MTESEQTLDGRPFPPEPRSPPITRTVATSVCAPHPAYAVVVYDKESRAWIGQCAVCDGWEQIGEGEPFTDALNHPPRRGLWRRLLDWVAK